MEDTFSCIIVMNIQDNSMKKIIFLKGQLYLIKMINGLPKQMLNGFHKKTLLWKITY